MVFRNDTGTFEGLTPAPKSVKTVRSMARWNVKASTLFVLSVVVFFMLVIVMLPDVDLPDTAFHRGTAPLVVHARATTAPPVVAVAALFQFPGPSNSVVLSATVKSRRPEWIPTSGPFCCVPLGAKPLR